MLRSTISTRSAGASAMTAPFQVAVGMGVLGSILFARSGRVGHDHVDEGSVDRRTVRVKVTTADFRGDFPLAIEDDDEAGGAGVLIEEAAKPETPRLTLRRLRTVLVGEVHHDQVDAARVGLLHL